MKPVASLAAVWDIREMHSETLLPPTFDTLQTEVRAAGMISQLLWRNINCLSVSALQHTLVP